MSDWQHARLGEHIELDTGFPFKSARYTEASDDIRLLRGDNIAQGDLRWNGVKRWPSDEASAHSRFEMQLDDIVLAMDRPWIDAGLKYAAIREKDMPCLLVQRVARMRAKQTLHQVFLRYIIGSQAFTDHVKSIITGVNVPHISGRDISSYEFQLPPMDIQQRIAGILSAYDDLIEVNQRRIAILEDMARRLFDEWFVRFRYPGHDAVPLVETELGQAPQGWKPGVFHDCISINPETLSPKNAPKSINYIDISSVSVGSVDSINVVDFAEAPDRARRIVRDGDIIWSTVRPNRRSHALVLDVASNTIASTGFAIVRATGGDWAWAYETTRTDAFVGFLVGRARGSAYPAVVGSDFEDAPILIPPEGIRSQFQECAGPSYKLAGNLRSQNARLRAARDLLLPKLISGEIDVGRAERDLAQAAE